MRSIICNAKPANSFKVVWSLLFSFIFFLGVVAGPNFMEPAYGEKIMIQGVSRDNNYEEEYEEEETIISQKQVSNNISMIYNIPKISTLLTIEEGMIYGRTMLLFGNLKIDEKGFITIKFPFGVTITDLHGISQKQWEVKKTQESTTLLISYNGIKHHIKSGNHLTINFNKEISGKSPYELPSPIITGIDRVDAELAIEAKENILIKDIKMEKGRQVDARELSFSPSEQILFAYKYTKEINLGMEMEKPKEVPVLTGTIDSVNAVSVMSAHGKILTRVLYQIKTNQVQYFTFTLPKAATLFSASVNSVSVKPMTSADGETLVPLKNIYGDVPRNVEIIYYTVDSHSKLAGNMKNILPKTVFPASELLWSVYLPSKDKPVLFGGNLEKIDLEYYNKKDYQRPNAGVPMPQYGASISDEVRERQYNIENETMNYSASRKSKMLMLRPEVQNGKMREGVLPVTFHIPERGTLVRFSGLFLMNEHPQAQVTYVGGFIYGLGRMVLIVIACLFLLASVRKIYPVLQQKLFHKDTIEHKTEVEPAVSNY